MKRKNKIKVVKHHDSNHLIDPCELEKVATEINTIANKKFADGSLGRVLRGYESEIRQEAVIKVLRWYLKHHSEENDSDQSEWSPESSLNYAIKWSCLDYIRKSKKKLMKTNELDNTMVVSVQHPRCVPECEWTGDQVQTVVREAISRALESGKISRSNARIANMIVNDGDTVVSISKRLGILPGAVYQQINRVKKAVFPILDDIDISFEI
jgi:hypothetical protein